MFGLDESKDELLWDFSRETIPLLTINLHPYEGLLLFVCSFFLLKVSFDFVEPRQKIRSPSVCTPLFALLFQLKFIKPLLLHSHLPDSQNFTLSKTWTTDFPIFYFILFFLDDESVPKRRSTFFSLILYL